MTAKDTYIKSDFKAQYIGHITLGESISALSVSST